MPPYRQQSTNKHKHTHTPPMKRTFEILACLALVIILSAVALGFCGYFG